MKIDWPEINWYQTTQKISQEVNKSSNWISKMRRKHAPHTVGVYITRTRRFTAECKEHQRERARINLKNVDHKKAVEAAKKSPKSGRFETNIHAKKWMLIAPSGEHYEIKNLHHFVRNNAELFNPEDVVWTPDGKYCAAVGGLRQAPHTVKGMWKGWAVSKRK